MPTFSLTLPLRPPSALRVSCNYNYSAKASPKITTTANAPSKTKTNVFAKKKTKTKMVTMKRVLITRSSHFSHKTTIDIIKTLTLMMHTHTKSIRLFRPNHKSINGTLVNRNNRQIQCRHSELSCDRPKPER